jgi:chromate transport protein ChrA
MLLTTGTVVDVVDVVTVVAVAIVAAVVTALVERLLKNSSNLENFVGCCIILGSVTMHY